MAKSQNGYSANDVNLTSSRLIPGTDRKIRVRVGAAGDLLLWVAGQFDRLVEDIDPGIMDDWGYAERPIRGDTALSNHASGTAIDLNAVRHPLGTEPTANFSREQIGAIRAIVARTDGCVRWGGDYTGRKDPMHFEIVASEARCAAVLAKLGEDDDMTPDQANQLARVHEQLTGTRDPNKGFPGFPSLKYPQNSATPVDFIRHIDQNLLNLSAKVDKLADAVAKLAAVQTDK